MSLTNNTNAVVITDATCLIILEKIGVLDTLKDLFPIVLTTPEIAKEYGKVLPYWIIVKRVEDRSLQDDLSLIVDNGEASAIALAKENNTRYLITDDLDARKLSIKLGIPIIGSLGVLIRAKEHGYIQLVKPYIDLMKQTNFRVSEELYKTALIKAGEA